MALQTHTQGCLLSEAFPRCCATKLHSSMGGRSEGGMDGSTEGWRVGATSAAYTHCRDNRNMDLKEGVAFRLAGAGVRSIHGSQAGRATGSRQSSRDKQAFREASARIPPSHLSSHISSSILDHLPAFSLSSSVSTPPQPRPPLSPELLRNGPICIRGRFLQI